jgi:hypothetical protein
VLEADPRTGAEVVRWVRKFPLMCSPRDYVFSRRSWVDGCVRTCRLVPLRPALTCSLPDCTRAATPTTPLHAPARTRRARRARAAAAWTSSSAPGACAPCRAATAASPARWCCNTSRRWESSTILLSLRSAAACGARSKACGLPARRATDRAIILRVAGAACRTWSAGCAHSPSGGESGSARARRSAALLARPHRPSGLQLACRAAATAMPRAPRCSACCCARASWQ